MSESKAAISFSNRARSAARSMIPASDRATVAPPETKVTAPAGAASATATSDTRPSVRIKSRWRAMRSAVAASGATKASGGLADGGTFISARKARISPIRSTSQPISASAPASTKASGSTGQVSPISRPSRAGPSLPSSAHSSSVM